MKGISAIFAILGLLFIMDTGEWFPWTNFIGLAAIALAVMIGRRE